METFLLVGLFALGLGIWWWWNKRRPAPVEDTWVLPSEDEAPIEHLRAPEAPIKAHEVERPDYLNQASAEQATDGAPGAAMPHQILDRETLLNRDRTFDPNRWDNTPDQG